MVRIMEPAENCSELGLFLVFHNYFSSLMKELKESGLDINTTLKIFNSSDFLKNKNKGPFLFSRLRDFGVVGDEDGEFSMEFKRWYVWWFAWSEKISDVVINDIRIKMDRYSGEMDIDGILQYRPSGRWQDTKVQ